MKSFIISWIIFTTAISNREYEYIEIVNLDRKPIVEARLNGKSAYFLIDTGSDISILNKDDRHEYGFRLFTQKADNHNSVGVGVGVGGKTSAFIDTHRVQLELGSTRINTRYMAYDLSAIVQGIHKNTGIEIAGIIGSDVMKRYGIIVDFRNKQIGILAKAAKER